MFGFFQGVTDPVCKMKVDKNKTKYSSEYKGQKYYFCSENCMNSFKEAPEKYNAPLSEASPQENVLSHGCCQQKSNA